MKTLADPAVLTLSEALVDAVPARTLYWGDGFAALAPALRGASNARWFMDAAPAAGEAPWAEAGRMDAGVLPAPAPASEPPDARIAARLPGSREALELLARVAAARLLAGGELWLAGHNREGVKSAARRLRAAGFADVETRLVRRHCRVLVARRGEEEVPPTPALSELERSFALPRPRTPRSPTRPRGGDKAAGADARQPLSVVSYPGTFSHGRLDDGSARLLQTLGASGRRPSDGRAAAGTSWKTLRPPRFAQAVDLGAGAGVLGSWLAAGRPGKRVTLCDRSAVAVASARATLARNGLDNAQVLHADVSDLPGRVAPVDLVVTNPPFHEGRREDRSLVERFVEVADALLRPGGTLWLVANRHLPYGPVVRAAFARADVAYEDRRYRVWRARKA